MFSFELIPTIWAVDGHGNGNIKYLHTIVFFTSLTLVMMQITLTDN